MPVTPPLQDDDLPADVADTLEDVSTTLGEIPAGYRMLAWSPPLLTDAWSAMRGRIKRDTRPDGSPNSLDLRQREAIALAASSANNCRSCVKAHAELCLKAGWTDADVAAILGVTAVCSMLNHHHRLRHLDTDLPLRDQSGLPHDTLRDISLPVELIELICVVVSGINACELCVQHHRRQAQRAGVSDEQLSDAIAVGSAMTLFNVFFRTQ